MIVAALHRVLKAYQPSLVLVAVRVPIGASGAPGTHIGKGATVTRTATGRYTITFKTNGTIGAVLWCSANVELDNAAGFGVVRRVTSTSAGTCTIQTEALAAPGTPADPTNGAFLSVFAVLRNSSTDVT